MSKIIKKEDVKNTDSSISLKECTDRELMKEMLIRIGEDPNREGLKGTPDRIVRMWKEIYRGYDKNKMPKVKTFNNGCDNIVYDQMINDKGNFYSQCEHHTVPFFGRYYFAYIPHKEGKLLGLSKVARVVNYFSARLQIQERLTHEIVDFLWNKLCNCSKNPLGMGLVMEGEHLCKTMRGVKKKGKMRTTKLIGSFKNELCARQEFLDWVNSISSKH